MAQFVYTTEVGTDTVGYLNFDHVFSIIPTDQGSLIIFSDKRGDRQVHVNQTIDTLLVPPTPQLFDGPPIISNIDHWVGQLAQVIKTHPSPTISSKRTALLLNLEMINKLLNEVP